jgi:hypothetical protein
MVIRRSVGVSTVADKVRVVLSCSLDCSSLRVKKGLVFLVVVKAATG